MSWKTIKYIWVLQISHFVAAQLVFFKHTVFLKVQILHSGEKGASKRPGEKRQRTLEGPFLKKLIILKLLSGKHTEEKTK